MAQAKRHDDEFPVDDDLVRRLLRAQFPQWAELPLRPIEPPGTDHTLFRLGDDLVVRMPCVERVTQQSQREARWVPFLAPQLPLELPIPVGMGSACPCLRRNEPDRMKMVISRWHCLE